MWVAGCGLRMSLNAFGCGRGTWVRMCIVLVGLLDSIDVDVYIDVNDVFFILLNLLKFFLYIIQHFMKWRQQPIIWTAYVRFAQQL